MTNEKIDFNPDVFVQRYADILCENTQLRNRRIECVKLYEALREKMQKVKARGSELSMVLDAQNEGAERDAVRNLLDEIFEN